MKPRTITAIVLGLGVSLPLASLAGADASTQQQVAVELETSAPKPATSSAPKPVSKKLTITNLDEPGFFTAQENPKEVHVDKSVPWTKAKTAMSDTPELEMASADGRTMMFELVFDTTSTKTDVHTAYVAKLVELAMVMDPSGSESKRRPPRVKVTMGASAVQFEGVIESVQTKYTSFLADGTPVVATAVVKLKEASRASFRKK
jgi:hypothetical protein